MILDITLIRKKHIFLGLIFFAISAGIYLFFQAHRTFQEFTHWKTKEAVLEKEIQQLKEEVRKHEKFLERLRGDPEFQDAVAKKELGYGASGEKLYRFPEENTQVSEK